MTSLLEEAATTGINDVVLRAVDISKTYGGTRALKHIDFEVRKGAVTVLFGENGAGKSTLMKILSGVEAPTGGKLLLDDKEVSFSSVNDAVDVGISIIHQELNQCASLNVRDNIFLGRELRNAAGVIDYARESVIAQELMDRLEEPISPLTQLQDLRVGQQQIVEIARALRTDCRVLIMDEPTSALSHGEVEVLFRVIRELTKQGVAIVYISHHLEEAIEIADYAVVFRDGDLVATADAADIDLPWVVRQMVGRDADYDFRDAPREYGDVVLSIQNVSVQDKRTGRTTVDDVSIEVRAGEIVCLYGLMGSGRTELMEALAGRDPLAEGKVLLQGTDLNGRSIQERISLGLGLVPEDRQRDGLVQMMSVAQNTSLPSLRAWTRRLFIPKRHERAQVERAVQEMHVKTASVDASITSLSGGNQQKVVIGKMMLTRPRVLLLDEPTRGIDVGAKGEIFALLFREAEKGLAVLYVTSEVGEAITASHRIIVMGRGRIVKEFDPRTCSRDEIMSAADAQATSTGHQNGAAQ